MDLQEGTMKYLLLALALTACGGVADATPDAPAPPAKPTCDMNADYNAALNIRSRARVSWPIVAVRLPKQLLLGLAEPATSSVL